MHEIPDSVNRTITRENSLLAQRENSSSDIREYNTLPRQQDNNSTRQQHEADNCSFFVQRENSTPNPNPNLLGNRENSSVALRNVLKLNQPYEYPMSTQSAVPPKALKLMGEDVFSPIGSGKPISISIETNWGGKLL